MNRLLLRKGWNGEIDSNTYDETVMYADYTLDKDRVVKLEPGKEYELKITVCNFSPVREMNIM